MAEDEIRRRFPRFPGIDSCICCEVHEGQMLYLPTGWWHEVTSIGSTAFSDAPPQHLAINYWFHPPDNLDPVRGFKRPYRYHIAMVFRDKRIKHWNSSQKLCHLPCRSQFWPSAWAKQRKRCRTCLNRGTQSVTKKKKRVGVSRFPPWNLAGPFGVGRRRHLNRFFPIHALSRSRRLG